MRGLIGIWLLTLTRRDERGATATEYAILVAVIALVLILGAVFFGSQLSTWFNNLGNSVSGGL